MNAIFQADLWQRLEQYSLDDPNASFPFTARLARENGWSATYTARVALEYKRFIYLMVAANHPVTPSEAVDQAWHLHLVYTKSYWDDLCGKVVGTPLHHGPTAGGSVEATKYRDWYERTLASYAEHFGISPPADIWPSTRSRFQRAGTQRWINTANYWLLPKLAVRQLAAVVIPLLVASIAIAWAAPNANAPWPFNLTGPQFLIFYIILFVLAFLASFYLHGRRYAQSGQDDDSTELTPLEVAILKKNSFHAFKATFYSLLNGGWITKRTSEIKSLFRPARYLYSATPGMNAPSNSLAKVIHENLAQRELTIDELWEIALPYCERARARLFQRGLIKAVQLDRAYYIDRLPILFVVCLGIARLIQGLFSGNNILFLLFSVVFAIAVVFARRTQFITPLGQKVLDQATQEKETIKTELASSLTHASANAVFWGVALFGSNILKGTDLYTHEAELKSLYKRQSTTTSTGGCGGAWGGGGCGGRGCGGGCGGCGGCGG